MRTDKAIDEIEVRTSYRLTRIAFRRYIDVLGLEVNTIKSPAWSAKTLPDYPEQTIGDLTEHLLSEGRSDAIECGDYLACKSELNELERRKDILCRWFRRKKLRQGEPHDGPRMSSKPAVGHGVRRKHKKLA